MSGERTKYVWQWSRRIRSAREDEWRERLSFLGPERLVVHERPLGKTLRLEVYDNESPALRRLAADFGGNVARLHVEKTVAQANAPRRPLRLGKNLGILDAHGKWPSDIPRPRLLLRIAGAMAFGTGEHATTSACLRLLTAEAAQCPSGWKCLDLGTGTGILAIAAEKLGAAEVRAIDYDTRAVKAAQVNLRRNRCRRVRLTAENILSWKPPRAAFRVVLANMFSGVLCAAAGSIAQAATPDGCLILSGLLRTQELEVLEAFHAFRMELAQASRRGKWVTLLLRRC